MISVIVPTHNRVKALQNCLISLFTQTITPGEIIVIDDGSIDGTKNYLLSLGDKIKIIYHEKNLGQSAARNSGIRVAQGDVLAFVDDDCVADENWLKNIEITFKKTGADAIIGKTIYVAENYQGRFPEKIVGNNNGTWPGAGNIAYKKEIFNKIGGFDSKFDPYHNEDSELAIRAAQANTKFVQSPEALVYHQKTFWSIPSLLASAKNPAVWIILKKLYPQHYNYFSSPVWQGRIISPMDYLFILFWPLVCLILFSRYWLKGKRDWKIFLIKWPGLLFLKRWHIYQEAWRQKKFII